MRTVMERIQSKVIVKDDGCWEWTGAVVGNGYACLRLEGKTTLVHRIVIADQLTPDLQVDHLCRNVRCVNPKHLEAVTQQENIRRQFAAKERATHCRHGHEYTPENTGANSAGGRFCIACYKPKRKEKDRLRYLARKAAMA